MRMRHLLAVAVLACGSTAAAGIVQPAPVAAANPSTTVQASTATVLDVSMGDDQACVLRADATIGCWETSDEVLEPPPGGPFTSVSVGSSGCALDVDAAVSCWGRRGLPAPDGRFKSLDVGWYFACGVREDDSVGCWGLDEREERSGSFRSVSAGGFACAITTDEQLECWDPTDGLDRVIPTPSGTFEAVDVSNLEACAIRIGGALACWSLYGAERPPMEGTFTAISGDCAIRTTGTINCRAWDGSVVTPLEGTFTKISGSCATRADGTLGCWENAPRPSVTVAWQDPWRLTSRAVLNWSGTPALSPVTTFDVRYKRARWDGRYGPWVNLMSATPLTSTQLTASPGYEYCLAVRARDADGAVSRWTGATWQDDSVGCTASPFDDRLLTRSAGWTALADPRYYRSTALRSSTRGARLTVSGITTGTFGLLVTTCPTCGSVGVTWRTLESNERRLISLYSPVRRDRQFIPMSGEAASRGALTLTVMSSARPVIVDGVVAEHERLPAWADWQDPPLPGRGGSPHPVARVRAGDGNACAVMGDASVTCWGENFAGQSSAPDDRMLDVSPGPDDEEGFGSACGLRLDGTIVCWGGDHPWLEIDAPVPLPGTFTALGGECGIRTDQSLACWGEARFSVLPSGQFTDISAGTYRGCAIRTDATLACWGTYSSEAPEGAFTAVAVGTGHICAIRVDKTPTCWGDNRYGQATPPSGEFTDIGVGRLHSCGIRTDGTIACWGNDRYFQSTPPQGAFTDLDAGDLFACAIRADAAGVACWGQNRRGQVQPTPTATMRSLATAQTSTAVHLSWTATSLADVTTYDVRYRRSRTEIVTGTSTLWRVATPARAATFRAAPGYWYCFAVRAHDADGRLSPWSRETCSEMPIDDRGLQRSSGWTAGVGTAFYGGTSLRASRTGSSLTRRVTDSSGLGLVATTCPTCGKVRVSFGGIVRVVDLASPTRHDGVYFPIWLGSESQGTDLDDPISGTVTIRVISSGKPVIIDGLAVSQPRQSGRPSQ